MVLLAEGKGTCLRQKFNRQDFLLSDLEADPPVFVHYQITFRNFFQRYHANTAPFFAFVLWQSKLCRNAFYRRLCNGCSGHAAIEPYSACNGLFKRVM